jgi:hypothetical protein
MNLRSAEAPPITLERDARVYDWLEKYDQIIDDFLPTANLLRMAALFAKHFPGYEKRDCLKLNPLNCRMGFVSCTSASIIIGRWWEKMSGVLPWYLLDLEGKPREQHVLVYLPREERSELELREELQLFRESNDDDLQFLSPWDYDHDVLTDYNHLDSIRFQPPNLVVPDHFRLIKSSKDFLENGMRIFGNLR